MMDTDSNEWGIEQMSAQEYYYNEQKRRQLYPKIMPDFAGIDDYSTDEGYCVDGFGNAACPLDVSGARKGSLFGFGGVVLLPAALSLLFVWYL